MPIDIWLVFFAIILPFGVTAVLMAIAMMSKGRRVVLVVVISTYLFSNILAPLFGSYIYLESEGKLTQLAGMFIAILIARGFELVGFNLIGLIRNLWLEPMPKQTASVSIETSSTRRVQ